MALDFLYQEFFGNTVLDYFGSVLILIIGVIIIFALKAYIFSHLVKRAKATKNQFDDLLVSALKKTLFPALFVGALFFSLRHLELNDAFRKAVNISTVVLITFLVVRFTLLIIHYALMNYWVGKLGDESKAKGVKTIMPVIKILVYGIGLFFLLDNLGVKISTLVAGLGIGGVAVALAGQAVLGDLFSYFAIIFDRPFELGDFIIVDTHMGVVEHVGIKTTRVKSLSGEQLVFSNTDLTNSRVRNYKRMEERRVVFKLGVIYQTSSEHLKEIPNLIKNAIEKIEHTRFDRSHFQAYGDFSLDFETVYYVYGADYNKYMDIQQEINLQIFDEFGKRKIEFAYPTQTLFLEKQPL